jgi:hypothetical protein
MKKRVNWLLVPAVAFSVGACKKKEETAAAPSVPAKVVEGVKEVVAEVVPGIKAAPKASAQERAAKLGFAKYLPQDTEVVFALHNGTKNINRVKASKLWKMIDKEMGLGAGADDLEEEAVDAADAAADAVKEAAPDEPADANAANEEEAGKEMGPEALLGEECTLAMGKTTGEQLGNVLTFARRYNYFQYRYIAKAFAEASKSGDIEAALGSVSESMGPEMIKDLINDPEGGIAILEKASMPPIYAAFKVKEKDREAAAQQLSSPMAMMAMMGEMVEPISTEKAGAKFEGFKISGAKLAEQMASQRETMKEMMDEATIERVFSAVAKKDLVILSGTIGDHVVLFTGGSIDDFKLTGDVNQSLVSSDALAFTDSYLSKDLAALVYGEKKSCDTMISAGSGIIDIVNGLRDGIGLSDGLGDTRDLQSLFQVVGEREAALRKLAGNESLGLVAFLEEGLKIESHGGYDSGMMDWKSPNKLAHLGKPEGVAMFANFNGDAAFDKSARAYMESLLETAYAITVKVSESKLKSEEFDKFKEGFKLFDTEFRSEATALWDAFSNDFSSSLGSEKAWIIDFNGAAPAIPGIPQKVVDEAKIPRISMISPVTDRAKLAGSWEKMNASFTSALGKFGKISGNEIPMQKPMSSEKNGLATWFFPMPLINDDFCPSVTVGDKWFVASSTKTQAYDLIEKATTGGEAGNGLTLFVDFKVIEKYSKDIYKIADENAEAMNGEPLSESDKKNINQILSALSAFDKLSVHSRRENSELRTSVHFKVR